MEKQFTDFCGKDVFVRDFRIYNNGDVMKDFSIKPKVNGYSYNTFPIFFMKKHYCPICSSKLEKVKNSKIVNSKSDEAKNFNFSAGDTHMVGSVKFVWNELHCPACNKNYTVKEIQTLEKQSK